MGLGMQLHSQVPATLLDDLHAFSRPSRRALHLGFHSHVNCPGDFASRSLSKKSCKRFGKFSLGCIAASLGESRVPSTGGLFWQPFWNTGANSGASSSSSDGDGSSLGFSGGNSGDGGSLGFSGGDSGDGGGSGNGDGGDGGGGFDSSGGEVHVNAVVEKEDEEQVSASSLEFRASGLKDEEQVVVSPVEFRAPGLASLSSAAGNALDGEAPFGDLLLLGRNKRAGTVVEETVPSNKGSQSGSSGTASDKENERDVAVQAVQNDGDEELVKRSETAALRRLQREAFADFLRVRERLDKLEFYTGLRPSKTQASLDGGGAKTRLKGEVCAGGAFVLLDDRSSRQSRTALEQAGLHTGLDVRFMFETPYREQDVMITECSAGHSGTDGSIFGGPVSVTKLVYNAQVTNDLTFVVAPLGAGVNDVTETVNPLQGQALTQFARVGPALYNHCVGSALGATLKGRTALVSLSQFLSGWGSGSSLSDGPINSGPLCLSTLAHVLFQPWESSVLSISAVNRFWPSPPLPSFRGLHWSEMGPLVLSKSHHSHRSGSSSPQMSSPRELRTSMDNTSMRDSRTSMDNSFMRDFRASMDNTSLRDFRLSSNNTSGFSANAAWGTPYAEAEGGIITIPETCGSSQQSFAVAGEIDVGANMSLAGWAQVDREYWLQEGENKEIEWGVSLTKAIERTAGWGVCVGSSKVDLWSAARDEGSRFPGIGNGPGDLWDMQLQVEGFLKLRMGRGFTLQPGLVYVLNKQSQTPAFVVRSSWAL